MKYVFSLFVFLFAAEAGGFGKQKIGNYEQVGCDKQMTRQRRQRFGEGWPFTLTVVSSPGRYISSRESVLSLPLWRLV